MPTCASIDARMARAHRATPNKRVALSPAAKVPITFRADKSYQDCGVSVKSGREVVRVFSQASIIKALVIFILNLKPL